MARKELKLPSRLLIGGIAGFVGTMAMTAAMRRMHRKLPASERYPLPPREIVDSTAAKAGVDLPGEAAKDIATAAHFAYGAAVGAVLGALNPSPARPTGAAAGVAVWLASYMGWIPAMNVLEPATRHPRRRNVLMLGAHLVWGWWTAAAMRELADARDTMLGPGPARDAESPSREREGG